MSEPNLSPPDFSLHGLSEKELKNEAAFNSVSSFIKTACGFHDSSLVRCCTLRIFSDVDVAGR